MPILHDLLYGTLDPSQVTIGCIRHAYVCPLPFRLRVGPFRRFVVTSDDKEYEIVIRNRIDVPADTSDDAAWQLSMSNMGAFHSDLIMMTAPGPQNKAAEVVPSIKKWLVEKADPQKVDTIKIGHEYGHCVKAFNRFLLGYHLAAGDLYSGGQVTPVTMNEFLIEMLSGELRIVAAEDYRLTDQELIGLCEKYSFAAKVWRYVGSRQDFSEEVIAAISEWIEVQDSTLYYQLLYEAKCRMVGEDHIGAILFAVMALEAIHATVFQTALRATGNIKDEDAVEQLVTGMLMERGLMNLYQLTFKIYLDVEDQPSADLLKRSKTGIEIRNEVMHSSRKGGTYKIHKRTPNDIMSAYEGVIKVGWLFERALWKLKKETRPISRIALMPME